MRNLLSAVMLFAVCSSAVAGSVTYPAMGNVRAEEGTVEMWVIFQFDPAEPRKDFLNCFDIFRIQPDKDNLLWLFWKKYAGYTGPYATVKVDGNKYVPFWAVEAAKGWKIGERHHLAYAWKGARSWWIIDGKSDEGPAGKQRLNKVPMNWKLTEKTTFRIGGGRCRVIIDDLRISSIARTEKDVGFHSPGALRPDPFTLLLDTFDTVEGTRTKPIVIAAEGQGGVLSDGAKVVKGIAGNGLQL